MNVLDGWRVASATEKSVAFGGKRKRSAAGLASIAPGEADGYAAWLGREVRPLHPASRRLFRVTPVRQIRAASCMA